MTIDHVEFLVEERSMEAALRLILPKVMGETSFEIFPSQCKDELLARLPDRLRGYARWLPPTWRIVVLMDRDNDDCAQLKTKIEGMIADAGLVTRTASRGAPYSVVSRLAIEELEAWWFGDWAAVCTAYPHAPKSIKYRDPDGIAGGTWEAFERILRKGGYFKGGLRKVEAAREIAARMQPERNTSRSFRKLCTAIEQMINP